MAHSRSGIFADADRAFRAMNGPKTAPSRGITVSESTRVVSNDSSLLEIAKSIRAAKPFLDQICRRMPHLAQDPDMRKLVEKLAPAIAISNALNS